MQHAISKALLFAAIVSSLLLGCSENKGTSETAQTTNASTGTTPATFTNAITREPAREGDSVWVLINHVKGDKKEQFERFVHEIFWDGAASLSQEQQRVFRQTRILHPTRQEKDGSYNYIFIMDPVLKGANYDIGKLMEKVYGKEKAAEYGKLYDEAVLKEQTSYMMVQSRH
jgi:hypothetical protein